MPEATNGGFERLTGDLIPVLGEGYPEEFLRPATGNAVNSITTWGICINTELIPPEAAPREFEDLADPRFAGQILVADPNVADVYYGFWDTLIDQIGEDTVGDIAANFGGVFPSGVPATQAVGAGEGGVELVCVPTLAQLVALEGAPVEFIQPTVTASFEHRPSLIANAPHPYKARLWIDFSLSREGIDAWKQLDLSPWDTDQIPSGMQVPALDYLVRQPLINTLLGVGGPGLAPPIDPADLPAVRDYLVTVLASTIGSGLPEAVDAAASISTLEEFEVAARGVADAYVAHLAVLTGLTPPRAVGEFHTMLIDNSAGYQSWFTRVADAIEAGDVEEQNRLFTGSEILFLQREELEVTAEQQRLIREVLRTQDDALSGYLVQATALQSDLNEELQVLLEEVQIAATIGDLDRLAAAIADEVLLLDGFLAAWMALEPPDVAAEYHELQTELAATILGGASNGLAALENEDLIGLAAALEEISAGAARAGDVLRLQTELLLVALESG